MLIMMMVAFSQTISVANAEESLVASLTFNNDPAVCVGRCAVKVAQGEMSDYETCAEECYPQDNDSTVSEDQLVTALTFKNDPAACVGRCVVGSEGGSNSRVMDYYQCAEICYPLYSVDDSGDDSVAASLTFENDPAVCVGQCAINYDTCAKGCYPQDDIA